MKLYQLALLVTTSLFVRADIAINDFLDFDGFIDFSFMVPIGIELESVEGNTVTLNIQSEEGSIYSIRHYPKLSLATWSVEGTTAILNETESSPVQNGDVPPLVKTLRSFLLIGSRCVGVAG